MELEKLAVTLRPRNSWEAIDLGLRLAIKHAWPLYASWLSLVLPASVLVFSIFGIWLDSPLWALFVLWWLKPAFDRIVVHTIGHAVFGEILDVRSSLQALPHLLRTTNLLHNLTLGRFSLHRSVRLPVDVLEGLHGQVARQRKALIIRRINGAALWQTVAWLHLETLFWLGCAGLAFMLIPYEKLPEPEVLGNWLFINPPSWLRWALYSPLWLGSLLLEPLYVAGGFMLYIKRRTDLEAWDVELQLRRLHSKHQSHSQSGLAAILLGLSLLCSAILPPPAEANETAAHREDIVSQAPAALQKVMREPDFGKEETEHKLRWRSSDEPAKKAHWNWPDWFDETLKAISQFMESVGNAFAWLGRIGGWLLITLAVAAIAFLLSRFSWRPRRQHRRPPTELAGFDIRPESLPEDIPENALCLLRASKPREALSLLFRGSLSRLAHQEHVPFTRGDTEGDCLMRVREFAQARAAFMARLLGCWQRLAYAHQEIGSEEIEALCQEWWGEFGRGGMRV